MGILDTFVRSAGDDFGVDLVGYVIDGETILVVSVADIAAKVFRVWALVPQALSIMHITILSSAARGSGFRGIRQINEDQTTRTSAVPRLRTNTDRITEILVDDNVVGSTVFVTNQICFSPGGNPLSWYRGNSPNR